MAGIYFENEADTTTLAGNNKVFTDTNTTRAIEFGPSTNELDIDDFLCFFNSWQGQSRGGVDDNETFEITAGGVSFGNFRFYRSDESVIGEPDILIVRKSDRAAIRITGDMSRTPTFTLLSNNANYPELQRLRLLGII